MLVAADTFRAAAADQLLGWAERSGATMERPNSSKQRPDGVISVALEKASALLLLRKTTRMISKHSYRGHLTFNEDGMVRYGEVWAS